MFGDYLIFDTCSKRNAQRIFAQLDKKLLLKRPIIAIGGISGTRKSETAFRLAELLIDAGKQCHVISGDDYYTVPWHVRNDVRRHNLDCVGPEEWDWTRLGWTFETFTNPLYAAVQMFQMSKFSVDVSTTLMAKSNCEVLIIEGLFACDSRIPANVRVHIGSTDPESTYAFRAKRKKENETSTLRQAIVQKECEAVTQLMENADIVVGKETKK